MGYIVYFNVVKSKDIINSPHNVRLDSMADRVIRGEIRDRDGIVLAETLVSEDGTERRNYPYGDVFGHVVGYDEMGKTGIESIANFDLLTSHAFFLERISKEFREEKNVGDNVITSLDAEVQQAAYDALGGYKGAVIVTEASTGKVLALVSKPSYNPNTILEDWEWLTEDEESRLFNRAMQGAYAPGSVFKIVTTLEYMRENEGYAAYAYDCSGEITRGNTTIHCAKNRAHGEEDLAISFANSCNASYVNIGLQLDLKKYGRTAEELLFNKELPNLLPYRQSKFQLTENALTSEIMMTAMGQGKTQMSPYHMNLITAAIANGGTLMKPYLVDRVENYTGTQVRKNLPEKYGRLMTSQEAAQLKDYMRAVVTDGTGAALQNEDYVVAGKTGTAEYSSDKTKSHSWFTGFTNMENPELVITVVVESADQSGMSAVTVAKRTLDAYYY
ncbi:MAG: penicillin-binding transpeptidase domain-containing protein [Faecalimonas sp.]|nr:penicillin-binding transpeptidase domain-containing protein [Faecalimonas sp.]